MSTFGKLIILCGLIYGQAASAIVFYKSEGTGTITKISQEDFLNCKRKFYRVEGRAELPVKERKELLRALLFGETIEDLTIVRRKLLEIPESCTYSADSETLKISDIFFWLQQRAGGV